MPLCRQLCLEVKRPRCQSFMSWGPLSGSDRRSSAAPLHTFHRFFPAMPLQHPNIGKTNWFAGENVDFFPVFPFFLFFLFSRFFLLAFFWISAFSFFWVGAFPRKVSPSTGFVFLPLVPSKTQSHSPKTAKRNGKWNHASQLCRVVHPQAFHQCRHRSEMCGVSARMPKDAAAKRRSGQRTEALRATQHSRQAWTAIQGWGIWYARTHTNLIDLAGEWQVLAQAADGGTVLWRETTNQTTKEIFDRKRRRENSDVLVYHVLFWVRWFSTHPPGLQTRDEDRCWPAANKAFHQPHADHEKQGCDEEVAQEPNAGIVIWSGWSAEIVRISRAHFWKFILALTLRSQCLL